MDVHDQLGYAARVRLREQCRKLVELGKVTRTTSHQPRTGATPRVYVRNRACG